MRSMFIAHKAHANYILILDFGVPSAFNKFSTTNNLVETHLDRIKHWLLRSSEPEPYSVSHIEKIYRRYSKKQLPTTTQVKRCSCAYNTQNLWGGIIWGKPSYLRNIKKGIYLDIYIINQILKYMYMHIVIYSYTSLRVPHCYIALAMLRVAGTPMALEESESAIGHSNHPMHCSAYGIKPFLFQRDGWK